ncbi:MAG: AAA family ATPase [Burkholderiaceae bacterium]
MEILKIDGFLTIKHAQLEIKQLNILIGPQASGKSAIAKLLYFFKDFINEGIPESARENLSKADVIKSALESFNEIFPRYSWEKQKFSIEYRVKDIHICVQHIASQSNTRLRLSFTYSDALDKIRRKIVQAYKKRQEELEKEAQRRSPTRTKVSHLEYEFSQISKQVMSVEFGPDFLEDSTFIPAGRSFFSNLQKNVFSFLAGNIPIDPFLKEFGSAYERSKSLVRYRNEIFDRRSISFNETDALIEIVLKGKYKFLDGQDWIESEHCRLNAANSSSGQQEALPMLVVLSVLPFIYGPNHKNLFFIEEPEAHLFPEAQQKIVKIISMIHNLTNRKNRFFLTTHSPYVLSVLNACILAGDVLQEPKSTKAWKAISEQWKNFSIQYEDVSAYSIQNGTAKKILNEEERLIDVNVIDSASEEINTEFDNLLDIKYENS